MKEISLVYGTIMEKIVPAHPDIVSKEQVMFAYQSISSTLCKYIYCIYVFRAVL